jgi:DNA-directed RNA polymerase subunit L
MENIKISLGGYRLDGEFKNVPVAFVNGIRRILLSEIPTVVVRDVQILDNSTTMIHEMLRHRVEMLPINVRPEETGVIRDTKIELRYLTAEKLQKITSDEFVVSGPRKNIILNDRDLDQPLFFMNLKPGESIHVKASLGIDMTGSSQVSVSTFKNHVDLDLAKLDRDTYTGSGGDGRVFDNYEIQRSYARDSEERPYWFDFTVESIGVIPAKDLLKQAITTLQAKVVEWCKSPILREEDGWYSIESDTEGHTVGAFAQSLIYTAALADVVSYRIVHPLLPKMVVRFKSKVAPETVIERFKMEAVALCESILKSV